MYYCLEHQKDLQFEMKFKMYDANNKSDNKSESLIKVKMMMNVFWIMKF